MSKSFAKKHQHKGEALVHTPGPWHVYTWAEHMPRAGQPSSVGQDDSLGMEADDVCEMLPIDWDDEQAAKATEWANARLIAAAPEMLEALRSCRMHIEALERIHNHELPEGEMLRAAIVKATGEVV